MTDTVGLLVTILTNALPAMSVFGGGLEENNDPTTKTCVTVEAEGGSPHPEIKELVKDRVKVKVWCGKKQDAKAKTDYGSVRGVLHGLQNSGGLKCCIETVGPQSMVDPDTAWSVCLGFYEVTAV